MESLPAHIGLSPLVRPAIALQGDLSALLQEGRVLAGQVLERLDGGSVLIAIGELRVPADAPPELQPGDRFRFVVERGADGELAMRVLAAQDAGDGERGSPLLRALRALLRERPVTERPLEQLAAHVRAQLEPRAAPRASATVVTPVARETPTPPSSAGPARPAALPVAGERSAPPLAAAAPRAPAAPAAARAADAPATRPYAPPATETSAAPRPREADALRAFEAWTSLPQGGEELRERVTSSFFGFDAARLAAAVEVLGDSLEMALRKLAAHLRARLEEAAPARPPATLAAYRAPFEEALGRALARLAGREVAAPLTAEVARELAEALRTELARQLEHAPRGEARELLREALRSVRGLELVRGAEGAFVRALLNLADGRGPAPLARSLAQAAYAGLALDRRGRLLAALLDGVEGPLRGILSRALAGLDLEQLLNLARRESGEPAFFHLPVFDGAGWASVLFAIDPRDAGPRGSAREAGTASFRITLGVEFARLGPLRADLVVAPSSLFARLRVTRAETAELLRARLPELREVLAVQGRRTLIAIDEALPDAVAVEPPHDGHLLDGQPLMDALG